VKWTKGTQNDDVVDARGKKPSGAVLGVDISGLFGSSSSSSSTTTSSTTTKEEPPKGPDPDAELVDYVRFVMKDVQDAFAVQFQRMGKPYPRAKLVLFTQAIDTKCGRSSAAIGPFYCPGDSNAYIDLSFYKDLRARFGAPGDFAQAYVLAHEMGHHVQHLLGLGSSRTNEHSVRVELQADCYAGVWGNSAAGKSLLEAGDLEEAITAAQAIGDDRLAKQAGAQVNPETFTHGSSAQRVKWFRRGFDAGKLEACDTFSVAEP
jgi:predicted metalloprotease